MGKVFWYDFKDDGLARDHNEANFGMVHHQQFNCAPKPAIVALAVFIRLTAGAECRSLARHGDNFAISFRRQDGSDLVIAWRANGKGSATFAGEDLTVTDMMGNPLGQVAAAIPLDGNPVYVAGRNLAVGW